MRRNLVNSLRLALAALLCLVALPAEAQRQMERLGRGIVVLRTSSTQTYIGWRLLGNDPDGVGFNLYRAANAGVPVKLNPLPLTNTTDYVDSPANLSTTAYTYSVVPVQNGVEVPDIWAHPLSGPFTLPTNAPVRQYLSVPLQPTPDGAHKLGYCWVGDLDGDGEYDYVVYRYNPNADTRQFVEGYLRDGTFLWRMDLGYNSTNHYNIEPGSSAICVGHGDNILVYDMDGDGKAEVVIRTARGVVFGDGVTNNAAVSDNVQFLSIVDGMTGAEKARATVPNPYLSDGPFTGHMGIFYADGKRPSVLWSAKNRRDSAGGDNGFQGGITSWDYREGQLTQRWSWFNPSYYGPEGHQIRLGDPDHDGKDEFIDIGFTIDDNGTPLFNVPETVHGDRFHMTDIDPDRPGLETFLIQQNNASGLATALLDSGTGKVLKKWYAGSVVDVGRGVVGDFSTASRGCEFFSTQPNTYDSKGNVLYTAKPFPPEAIWWDSDLLREFCATVGSTSESPAIEKFNPADPANKSRLYTIYNEDGGCYWGYGARPPITADIFGDWREEVVTVANDNSHFRIYTTKNPAINRLYTLMHNGQYRIQATTRGYTQSSYVDYYLGTGMEPPPPSPFCNAALVWRGGGANTWDAGATANWLTNNLWVSNSTTVAFNNESVLFDLSGSNHTAVTVVGSLTPAEVTVYSPKNFTFGGSGSLEGAMKLTKVGGGQLILTGTNNYTGATLVAEGGFIINGSLPASPVTVRGGVWLDGRLGGNGVVGSAVTLRPGAGLSPGPGTNSPARLTIANNLTLAGLTLNDFDLSDDATGTIKTNDLAVVTGNLTLQGTNTFVIRKLNATLPPGVYPLINYSGALSGNINSLLISGLEGIPVSFTNPPGQIALVVKATRPPATLTWTGGKSGNAWDLVVTTNWLNGANKDLFVPQDSVRFDNTGSSNLTVNLTDSLPVTDILVDSTANYTFTGSGSIIGSGSLVKSNTGTLTINTLNNSFTGRTLIAGGMLVVAELDALGFPSPLGNAGASPTNLVLSGNATLRIMGESYTDRGLTLNAGTNSLDIFNAADQLTIANNIVGSGTLQKLGGGMLALTASNSYTGGTIIQSGSIVLGGSGGTGNRYGVGTGSVTFINGTLSLLDLQSSYTYAYPFIVPTNGTGRIDCDGRSTMTGSLTGGGTFTVMCPYVRTDLNGNWSAFTGQLNASTDSDGGSFRINNSAGLPNAKVNVANLVSFQNRVSGTPTISLGELSGAAGGNLSGGTGSDGLGVNWNVGGLNTSFTFAGNTYNNVGLVKVGTGTLTLSGTNLAHTGPTTVNGGTLLYNGTGSNSTSVVTVGTAGTLGGTGSIGGTTTVNGKLAPGVGLGTLRFKGNLTFGGSGSAVIEIRKSPLGQDLASVGGNLTYAGNLVVSNLAGTLAGGDSFKIFDAPAYAGAFNAFSLPPLTAGLTWDTAALTTSGTLSVVSDNASNPPTAPGGLLATAVSFSQINLSWTDNSTNESSFLIERSIDNTNFTQIASVAVNVTSYPSTGLAATTPYYYRVRASNSAGASGYSNTASATTLAAPTILTWRGDGAANLWNVGGSSNWVAGGILTAFGDGATVTFDDSGSNNTPVSISGTPLPAAINFNATKNYTINGAGILSGSGSLNKSGTGTLTINTTNAFSGGINISNGSILIGNIEANRNGYGTGIISFYGGTLQFNGYGGNNGTGWSGSTNTFNVPAGQTGTLLLPPRWGYSAPFTSPLSGGGTLNVTVDYIRDYFSGDWSAFTGQINFSPRSGTGDFRINNPNGYSNAAIYLNSGVNLYNINVDNQTTDLGELGGATGAYIGTGSLGKINPTWRVGAKNTTSTYAGILADSGVTSLIKIGTGTLILTGTNTYSGLTTISSGTLQIGDGGTAGTLATNNLVNNATLAFSRADAFTDSGIISGTGRLRQLGDGVLTLTRAHTYAGATLIEAGTLALTGSGSIASSTNIVISLDALLNVSGRTGGSMTLASGKLLSGNGAVKGNFILGSGAKLSPGEGIGTLTFSNALTLSAGSTTTLEISKNPLAHDLVRVLGNLSFGGTLLVTNLAGTFAPGDTLQLFESAGSAGSFASLSLPPLPGALAWDTGVLYASGTISVVSTVPFEAWGQNEFNQAITLPSLTNVVAIAAGGYHNLALLTNGSLIAWGNNGNGQCNVPAGLTNVVAIAAGDYHSLAAQPNGRVTAWGAAGAGQLAAPPGATNIVALAGGEAHSLALRGDGIVLAWGDNTWGQTNVPAEATNIIAIAAGAQHSLALKADGTVLAWGGNLGPFGDYAGQSVVPFGLNPVIAVAAGGFHSLALLADGTVTGWGDNSLGQLNAPGGLTNVVAISGGTAHSLALRANGTVAAWGDNLYGQGTVNPNLANVTAVAAGGYHNLALQGVFPAVPQLTQAAHASSVFTVSAPTERGRPAILFYKNLLTDPTWNFVQAVPGDGGQVILTDRAAGAPQRIYRIRRP